MFLHYVLNLNYVHNHYIIIVIIFAFISKEISFERTRERIQPRDYCRLYAETGHAVAIAVAAAVMIALLRTRLKRTTRSVTSCRVSPKLCGNDDAIFFVFMTNCIVFFIFISSTKQTRHFDSSSV